MYKRQDNKGSINADKVGYVGSLNSGKGIEIILELARLLPDVGFVVVGGGEEKIESIRRRSPLNNVQFMGFLSRSELSEVYPHFSVVLLPLLEMSYGTNSTVNISRWTSPLKLFEYMAYGKAIVASRLPVLREVLEDNVHVRFADPSNVSEWAEIVTLLIEDEGLRDRLGGNALALQQSKYTWDKRAGRVLENIVFEN